ncbi:BLUF domain-containing protein [Flammeovirga sp. MY04]|uniref:BLUF domain-containing protein n=1 Tax=Flammeovirga sp. MY04 TaxID=1191459 RepID=UPI0008061CF9|nr:BLUF domain-containing protein [Flammeovirga sp. MY04]ANQ50674.1 BLUF domain-containing protein [Flammeovirga sp. MY04]
MYCLCYISTRNEKLNDDVLKEILTQSRKSNQNKELTGLLVLMDNQFLQILEGEEKEVNSLYNKICKDTRHSYVQKIYSGELDKRNFASWDMAFHEIHWEDLEDAGLLTQYENGGKLSDYLKDKNHYVIEYLKSLNGIEKLQLNLPK